MTDPNPTGSAELNKALDILLNMKATPLYSSSDAKPSPSDVQQTTEWVITIRLGDIQPDQAGAWMTAVESAVLAHDPGFDGVVEMRMVETNV